ncbi:hypothetical protein HG531_012891 [Fusarium graminearum]|nr:hypothetical protein HG531_012891 [Fusarium graminearum]
MTPGATKMKLKMVNSFSWSSATDEPICQKGYVHTLGDEFGLFPKRRGKLVTVFSCTRGLGSGISDHVVKFLLDGSVFGDNIDDELSWVNILGARSTIASKVARDSLGLITDVTKVHSLATLGKEKNLADSSQLSKEANSVVSRLPIKTRSRLVQEDKNARLRHKFNTNGDTLALFNAQSGTNLSNEGVGDVVKFEKVDDSVNILQLLLARGCLDGVSQVLPSKNRSVANEIIGDSAGVGVITRDDTIFLTTNHLLLALGLTLFVGLAKGCGDVSVLSWDDQRWTILGRGMPLGGEKDGDSDEEKPPSPDDTKVSPKVIISIGKRSQVVIASNESLTGLRSTYTSTSLVITIVEARTTGNKTVADTRDDLSVEFVRDSDDKAGDLGSIVEILEGSSDGSEEGGDALSNQDDPEGEKVPSSPGLVLEKNRATSEGISDLRHGNERVGEKGDKDGTGLDE